MLGSYHKCCANLGGLILIISTAFPVCLLISPFRETSNVYDGSAFTADMAVQNVIGDAMRGATWVAIHNGGNMTSDPHDPSLF